MHQQLMGCPGLFDTPDPLHTLGTLAEMLGRNYLAPNELVGYQRLRQREIKRRDAARIRNAQSSVDCGAPRKPPCVGNPKAAALRTQRRRQIDYANQKMIEMILQVGQKKLVPDETAETAAMRARRDAMGDQEREKQAGIIDADNRAIRRRLLDVGPSLDRKQWEADNKRHHKIAAHMSRFAHLHFGSAPEPTKQVTQQAWQWQSRAAAAAAVAV